MARSPQASRKSKSASCACWTKFIFGLVVGALATGIICYQWGLSKNTSPPRIVGFDPNKPAKSNKKPAKRVAPKPRFEFYDILAEDEIAVSEEEVRTPPKVVEKPPKDKDKDKPRERAEEKPRVKPEIDAPAASQTTSDGASYLLQMGAFSQFQDADRLKAQLSFQGVQTHIQKAAIATSKGETTLYRVRGGPYTKSQANDRLNQLKAQGIKSTLIRVKH